MGIWYDVPIQISWWGWNLPSTFAERNILHVICQIYRASIACCYIPTAWRVARVTFLPGKTDYTGPKSFQPLSLTSFLLKGLEKLVDRHLRDGPMAVLPMHPRQHAYQAGKSTESALHQLVGRIEKALDAKEFALEIFFDIEGAFDNTPCNAVRTALEEWRIHRAVKNWIITVIQREQYALKWIHVHHSNHQTRVTTRRRFITDIVVSSCR